jgi:hypothetical protein
MSDSAVSINPFMCKRLRKRSWSVADSYGCGPFQSWLVSISDRRWSKHLEIRLDLEKRALCWLGFAPLMRIEYENDVDRRGCAL